MANVSESRRVDPGNAEQARAWDGAEGAYWAEHADIFERSVAGYDDALFEAAAIDAHASVLDVGCGTGSTTRTAARIATSGQVPGVDLSEAMIAEARQRAAAEGLTNARFEQADAQVYPFAGHADVAISRTAVMFFGDPVAGLMNLRRAMREGGRLAALVWQLPEHNEWFAEVVSALAAGRSLPTPPPGAPSPFALGDPGRAESVVQAAGFSDITVAGLQRPMFFGADAPEAFDFILGQMGWRLEGLDEAGRQRATGALRASVENHVTPDGVLYGSAAWLLTARA